MVQSLRALTLAFLFAFGIAIAATGFAVYAAERRTVVQSVDRRIDVASRSVAGLPGDPVQAIVARIETLSRHRDTGDIGFFLADAGGRRLGGNVALGRSLPAGFSSLQVDDRIEGLTTGRALVRTVGRGLVLTTIAETEPVDGYHAARLRIYWIGCGSMVAIVVGGVCLLGIVIGRRAAAMQRTVEAIIDGDMQRRVPITGSGGTFDDQARAFNRMLDRIAELMTGISNVSNDIAHDLRSPLGRLRSRLALVTQRAGDARMRADLEEATAQSDSLLTMFDAVLRIAEVEGGDRRAGFRPLDLAQVVGKIGAMIEPVVSDTGRTLVTTRPAAIPVIGDEQLINQALLNLINNAVRHTPVGARITVGVERLADKGIVTVTDDGPGIPPDQHARALRRFGRLDPSRAQPGFGLGLPLVQAIMRLHRGDLVLADAGPGLVVLLSFPLQANEAEPNDWP